jgi:YD repeat-containing protein
MKAKYFQDTDTLYLELRDSEVVETRDLDQDTLLDYDGQGNVVGITIEHAKTRIGGPRIELETIQA